MRTAVIVSVTVIVATASGTGSSGGSSSVRVVVSGAPGTAFWVVAVVAVVVFTGREGAGDFFYGGVFVGFHAFHAGRGWQVFRTAGVARFAGFILGRMRAVAGTVVVLSGGHDNDDM